MSEYKDKNLKELLKTLEQKRSILRGFRFSVSGSKTRNVKEGRDLRKEIAKILTEVNRQMKEVNG